MLEATKDIVIAMIQNGLIVKTDNNETNIKAVNNAIVEIMQQINKAR